MSDPGNGGGEAQQLTPEQQAQLEAEMGQMLAVTAGIVRALAPHLSEEQAQQLAAQAIAEHPAIAPAIDDAVPTSAAAQSHPWWGFRVYIAPHKDAKGNVVPPQEVGRVQGPKIIGPNTPPHEVVANIHVLAIATAPIARAVLRAHGYTLDFYSGKTPKEKSKLILPG